MASYEPEPTLVEVEHWSGLVVIEFGAAWCGYCQALRPRLVALLGNHAGVRHVKVEDGPGKPLGRSFQVKLWPTLVFLHDGKVVQRLVRPTVTELEGAFAALARYGRGADESAPGRS